MEDPILWDTTLVRSSFSYQRSRSSLNILSFGDNSHTCVDYGSRILTKVVLIVIIKIRTSRSCKCENGQDIYIIIPALRKRKEPLPMSAACRYPRIVKRASKKPRK